LGEVARECQARLESPAVRLIELEACVMGRTDNFDGWASKLPRCANCYIGSLRSGRTDKFGCWEPNFPFGRPVVVQIAVQFVGTGECLLSTRPMVHKLKSPA
jgi:hypothetical protein